MFNYKMDYTDLYKELNGKTVVVINKSSVGTGFIVSKKGIIATAEHVVSGSDVVEIITGYSNPTPIPAQVIKRNQKLDLALLKIPPDENLPEVELGESHSVDTGDEIIIIGFPFGNSLWGAFMPAIHRGIISNKLNVVEQMGATITQRFQLDIMANKGNSGGPVVLNKNGKVIGILTSVFLEKPIGDSIIVGGKSITSPTGIAIATPIIHLKEMIQEISN